MPRAEVHELMERMAIPAIAAPMFLVSNPALALACCAEGIMGSFPAHGTRDRETFAREHLPGAVYAHLDRDLSGPRTGKNGRHPMPSIEAMVESFSRFSIDEEVQVVAYDTSQGQMAARLWSMLASGKVRATIGARYPLRAAADAHRALESRGTRGSQILIP